MSLSIPYTFTGGAGNKAKASEVNANFQAVANKFTEGAGGIADGDISTSAGIKGTKLSNVAGNRVPTDRIEDAAITTAKLKADAGGVNGAVGSADQIKDAIITNAKLVNATLLPAKAKITTTSYVALNTLLGQSSLSGWSSLSGITTIIVGDAIILNVLVVKITGAVTGGDATTGGLVARAVTSLTDSKYWIAVSNITPNALALTGHYVSITYWTVT